VFTGRNPNSEVVTTHATQSSCPISCRPHGGVWRRWHGIIATGLFFIHLKYHSGYMHIQLGRAEAQSGSCAVAPGTTLGVCIASISLASPSTCPQEILNS